MRRKLVLWGSNEKEEKILVALHLRDREGIIDIYTFDENQATEKLYNDLINKWRNGQEIEMPDNYVKIERPLNMSDSILPDEIRVKNTDIIKRAQAEWHFVVLSAKLYEMYKSELEEFHDKIDSLENFDRQVWNDLKAFWTKVQEQVMEKNIFREHAASLKNRTNKLFDRLKELKKKLDEEFEKISSEHKEKAMAELKEIDEKIEKGLGLKPIFEKLKELQNAFRGIKFTRKDRDEVFAKLDKAFKEVKAKRFGDRDDSSALSRHERRYNGLINAIQKMEKSIARDRQELEFQERKIATTDGQLEMQIRQAKVKMIQERIKSKTAKLDDMLKTKVELEKRINKEKQKLEKQKAREEAQAKIAEEVKKNAEKLNEKADELKKAAEKIAESKQKQKLKKDNEADSLIGAVMTTMGEAVENVVDTAKAIGEVVGDKIEEKVKAFNSDEKENDAPEPKDETTVQNDEEGGILSTLSEMVEDVVDTAKEVGATVSQKIEEGVKSIMEKENSPQKSDEKSPSEDSILSSVTKKIEGVIDEVKNTMDDVEEKVKQGVKSLSEIGKEEVMDKDDSILDTIGKKIDKVVDEVKQATGKIEEKIEENRKRFKGEEE